MSDTARCNNCDIDLVEGEVNYCGSCFDYIEEANRQAKGRKDNASH